MSKPNTIYIVGGAQGDYSDRSEWEVAAYYDRAMADEHARLAKELAEKRHDEFCASDYDMMKKWSPSPYDPHVDSWYDTPHYYVIPLVIRDTVPSDTDPMQSQEASS